MSDNNSTSRFSRIKNRLSDVAYDVDDRGMPILPEELEGSFYTLDASTEKGRAEIVEIAQRAFDIWNANGRVRVDLSKIDLGVETPCSSGSLKENQIFIDEAPMPADFDSKEEFEYADNHVMIGMAKAKKACASCPLQAACISSSITVPVKGRDRQVDENRIALEPVGIWGGYGVSAREMILREFCRIWFEYDEAVQNDLIDRAVSATSFDFDRDYAEAEIAALQKQ